MVIIALIMRPTPAEIRTSTMGALTNKFSGSQRRNPSIQPSKQMGINKVQAMLLMK